MAIVRMISRDPAEFRAFQSRMTTVGKIRIGRTETPEGKRSRPVKLDTFRFTSPQEALIRVVAGRYGGEASSWTPQGARQAEWEVISDVAEVPVYLVNGQDLDPWYEAWAAGRTCVRRCDGEINKIDGSPCLCNGPDRPADTRQLCKPTIRAVVMLPEVPGINSWMLESHGENACSEISTFGPLVARSPMPIPAVLRLRKEVRREWNPDKKGGPGFDTKDFYVPWFDVSAVTSQQVAIGGDPLTQALLAAGAPALLGGDRRAIEAAPPMSAPPAQQAGRAPATAAVADPAGDDPQGGTVVSAEEHGRILAAVEAKVTLKELDGLREAMVERNIRYRAVQDAWVSKRAAIIAADNLARDDERADQVAAAIAYGPEYFADDAEQYTEAVNRGATHEAIVEAGGPLHWLATDDQLRGEADAWRPTEFDDPPEYAVGDTVTVGGIEFTKISDNPFEPGSAAAELFGRSEIIEGTVEDDGTGLPMLPAGTYEVDAELPRLMAVAGKFRPPLTTDQVRGRLLGAFGLKHMGEATGEQYARLRTALERELTG